MSSETKRPRRLLLKLLLSLLILAAVGAGTAWHLLNGNALSIEKQEYFIVKKQDNFDMVVSRLEKEFGLKYPKAFRMIAERMNVPNKLRAGRYTLQPGMSNRDIATALRKGGTKTVDLVIRGLMGKQELATLMGSKLEPDAADYLQYLYSTDTGALYGFNDSTILAMVIPNTYNVYWMSSPEDIFKRLHKEYLKFWTGTRKQKAGAAGLNPLQVSILASIVDKETSKTEEMPTVAGLYINRLRMGMKLQSDPTVKFALDSPEMKRIYLVHTRFPSPYNTYIIKGLPPGPLCIPSQQAIDAVLNYQEHHYIFMCAREDFSGYHNFAVTDKEHEFNSRRYHNALDRLEAQKAQ